MTQVMPDREYPDSCIAMFARAPIKGQVKTRLIPALGDQGALDMHVKLMNRQIDVLNSFGLCSIQLWVDQARDHSAFLHFEGEIKLQKGLSLGDKMFHAAKEVLQESSQVVIIGSDCPGIDKDYLKLALQELDNSSNDVVLGPAVDGGYVLIAMKSPYQQIFQDIDWGSAHVLQQTVDQLKHCGLGFSMLPALRDIDTAEDLESLV